MWRLGILIAIVGSLAVFAWQNSSPGIALVFLGMRSQAMPLAFWILLALLAGVLTQLLLTGLYQIGLVFSPEANEPEVWGDGSWQDSPVDDRPRPGTRLDPETAGINDRGRNVPEPAETRRTESPIDSDMDLDEDESDVLEEDDWDEEPQPAPSREPERRDPVYEREQQPRSQQRDGSVYSFSYRDATAFGAGRTEDVYDAEYRVLIPPYRSESGIEDEDQDLEEVPEYGDALSYPDDDRPADWANDASSGSFEDDQFEDDRFEDDRFEDDRFEDDRLEPSADLDDPDYDPVAEADRLAGIRTGKPEPRQRSQTQRPKVIWNDRPALTSAPNDWEDLADDEDDWEDWDDSRDGRDRDWS